MSSLLPPKSSALRDNDNIEQLDVFKNCIISGTLLKELSTARQRQLPRSQDDPQSFLTLPPTLDNNDITSDMSGLSGRHAFGILHPQLVCPDNF